MIISNPGNSGNLVMTLSPSMGQIPKAENLLKTKARQERFSSAKAENILKIGELQEVAERWNYGDNLSGRAERGGRKGGNCQEPFFCREEAIGFRHG
jgi:hypothetical protein